MRGSKTVNDEETTYFYVGDKLYYQHTAKADGSTNYELYFYYDSYDNLSALKYYLYSGTTANEYTYYVSTNASGDVLGLYGGDGILRVAYEYDAWGNVISVADANDNEITNINSIAHRNPIRYRGYYYDNDLGLYYLQSRYYDANIGRFINSDNIGDGEAGVLGSNTFVYSINNPIKYSDPSGHSIIASIVIGIVVGAAVSAIVDVGCQLMDNNFDTNNIDWRSVGRSAVIGGICGGISGGVGGAIAKTGASILAKSVANIVADGCVNVIETSLNAIFSNSKLSFNDCVYSFASGMVSSAVGCGISKVVQNVNVNKFNSLSNSQKKIKLNSLSNGQHITRSMINNSDYLSTSAYDKYISKGSTITENIGSSAMTIGFSLFER